MIIIVNAFKCMYKLYILRIIRNAFEKTVRVNFKNSYFVIALKKYKNAKVM